MSINLPDTQPVENFVAEYSEATANLDIILTPPEDWSFSYGSAAADTITLPDTPNNFVVTGAEDDLVQGGKGNDVIITDNGNDILKGGKGNDVLIGGTGDDRLHGAWGDDIYFGEEGADVFVLSKGNDVIADFEPGIDSFDTKHVGEITESVDAEGGVTVSYEGGGSFFANVTKAQLGLITEPAPTPTPEPEHPIIVPDPLPTYNVPDALQIRAFSVTQNLEGIAEFNFVDRSEFNQETGFWLDDDITGTAGSDWIRGGLGNDILRGRRGDDLLSGGIGDDVLRAGRGDDIVYGGLGNDKIFGGAGDDLLWGGQGEDKFVLCQGDDIIQDFELGVDTLGYFRAGGVDNVFGQTHEQGTLLTYGEDSTLLVGVNFHDAASFGLF